MTRWRAPETGSPGGPAADAAVRAQFLEHSVGRNLHTWRWAAFEHELPYVRGLLPTFASRRVLDLGCGPGALTDVYASDVSASAVKVAGLVSGDAERL